MLFTNRYPDLIDFCLSVPLWTMGPACPYPSSASRVKSVNLELILIKPRLLRVDIVPAAPSQHSKAQPHVPAVTQESSLSEDQYHAIFAAPAPTPKMHNQGPAPSVPQGNMLEIQGPQRAILFLTAHQEPGQNPWNISLTPCAPLIQRIMTKQSKCSISIV
jgi:hypothetical protein